MKQLHGYALPFRANSDAVVDANGDTVAEFFESPDPDGYHGPMVQLFAAAPDLADALKECADDLESELNEKYTAELRLYPSQQAKYQRDMKPVLAARAALANAGVK